MNRADRRAIARGEGRHESMIEIVDHDSLAEYAFALYDWDVGRRILDNQYCLFISHQLSYLDIRDEFMEDPYLLH